MPNFFDLFSGNTRSASQGTASPDLPSDGARQTQIGAVLEGIADAAETGSQFVNAFTSGSQNGKAVSRPVETTQDAQPMGMNKLYLIGGLIIAGLLLWRLFKR